MTEPRGGNVSTYLTAEEWEALEKHLEEFPYLSRAAAIKAALRAYLRLDE